MAVVEHRFRVMASEAHVLLVGAAPDAAAIAVERLRALEQRWSRFLPDSDLARLNRSGGGTVGVGADTIVLIDTMQRAAAETQGAFDPTMLAEIVCAGYERSIEDPQRLSVFVDMPAFDVSVHDVFIDRDAATISMPAGLGLDPGGIGKGLAADLVVRELLASGADGALISIGGDMSFAGASPFGNDWEVVVGDPFDDSGEVARIGVDAGGVATSSTRSRRWRHRGVERHHVLDPVDRRQSCTDLAAVTVVAGAGWLAEAHATAALLQGRAAAAGYLGDRDLSGVIVDGDGAVSATGAISSAALQPS